MDSRKEKRIIVLHEYGSNSHYNALQYLCEHNNINILYREFRVFHLIGSGIKHRQINKVLKQAVNICCLIKLASTKGEKVVLGMHPYDKRLPILSFILRNHTVYYHTSYTSWFPDEMESTRNTSKTQLSRIKNFIRYKPKHIFAVTQKAKDSLCSFTGVDKDKVSVVYHSYMDQLKMTSNPPLNTYIYVGRMDRQKGVTEICDYFVKHPELTLTLIGEGNCTSYITNISKQFPNIKYVGYVKGLNNIMPLYNQNAYFILNSKRTEEWEELFGQVIFESMACGCVPICVNHSGPKEIVSDKINGFLFQETEFSTIMDYVKDNVDYNQYLKLRKMAYLRGHEFEASNISSRWMPILK